MTIQEGGLFKKIVDKPPSFHKSRLIRAMWTIRKMRFTVKRIIISHNLLLFHTNVIK